MTANTDTPNTCPVQHTPPTTQKARCPVEHARQKKAEKAAEEANTTHGCPVDHETREEYLARAKASPILNPRNQMPELPQQPAEGQSVELSTERMISSIPKNEMKEKWEYPSPQQFYHALRRKGMEAPEHEMELMVDIHNFLNEACWVEILKWEELQGSGCDPLLLRFRGRPNTLSPKARLYTLFGGERPFDRHDWTISRCGKEVRYILDYYSAPPDENGEPVFYVDVRPALDSPSAAWARMRMGARELKERWQAWFNRPETATSLPGTERPERV